MNFTDIFVKRPVLATVVNLLILLVGLRSIGLLEVRQYPETQNTVVSVTTSYPGAGSQLVKGFITTPLQQAIAEAEGIDFLTSTSTQGVSKIEAHMKLNYDASTAVANIQAKVASQRNILPADAEDPVIDSTTGDATALMYIAFDSENMSRPQITDYIQRVVKPQLQALEGVGKAQVFGQEFAMRVWLDPQRMAALGVSADQVAAALRANNYLSGAGGVKGKYVREDLLVTTDVADPEGFRNLVVREDDGILVRLRDVARVELGGENYESTAWRDGMTASFIGIEPAPGANPLNVAARVTELIPKIQANVPLGLNVIIPYDASRYISDAIDEVYRTLGEALLIVLGVIYLSLGSLRAAMVPAVAVPLSLIGAAFIMFLLGYSLNLLTLLSMVLAIGLVVDDAIIVVENVHRHIEQGMGRFEAAIQGARELAMPIIAMTTTLLAVYAPIGFMGGLVGTLFTEFAFTLAAAVIISGVVALTLSPMLASKFLKPGSDEGRFEKLVERFFHWLSNSYRRVLSSSLKTVPITLLFALAVLVSIYFLFISSKNELAPTEDQGILFFMATAPRTATLDYHIAYASQMNEIFDQYPEKSDSFYILGMESNTIFGGFKMKSYTERERSQMELQPQLQGAVSQVAGLNTVLFPMSSLPGSGGGLPVQFVITSDQEYDQLVEIGDQLIGRAMQTGQFMFLSKSVEFDRPITTIHVDRERAADLGITMADIGRNLANLLSGGEVNRFSMAGRSYKVIPQLERNFRLDTGMLNDYRISTTSGELIPLSSVVRLEQDVEPAKRSQHQQLNALTVEGVMQPGVSIGEALGSLQNIANEIFPKGFSYDYTGDSRQFIQEGSALMTTFVLALIVIYLVLAAQYESWRDPLIILISVPMSLAGAMAFISLGFASLNIYTQVGLITLIGVVAKNGILIVEFANKLQLHEGLNKHDAVVEAASIRLRPILMTSASLVVAMIPLLTAAGPGAISRFSIGLTIATGLGIGTLFTLFVQPAFYMLLAEDKSVERRSASNMLADEV
ncbi:MAG: efflux RND transporter permease subunit [Gammaproteobacteria bacterium]|nr:efflux RND transporter permease subunit [Gammaproteobacteria bacterium]